MGSVLAFFSGGGMCVWKSGMTRWKLLCDIMFVFVFQSVKIVLAFYEKTSRVPFVPSTKLLG